MAKTHEAPIRRKERPSKQAKVDEHHVTSLGVANDEKIELPWALLRQNRDNIVPDNRMAFPDFAESFYNPP